MTALSVLALAGLTLLVPGVVVRTKAWWAGRRGPPVTQLPRDLARLLRKETVVSAVATPVFLLAPWVTLAAALAAAAVVPVLGVAGPVAFTGDIVWLAYATGLGRVARVLGALDTGSPFEGMGAARTASFAVLVEPALFLALGAGAVMAGDFSVAAALRFPVEGTAGALAWAGMAVALAVVLLVEASRMPVDDPTTHLELTMIHEVTVLDHGGPPLAAYQLAAAVELTAGLGMLSALCVPRGLDPATTAALTVAGTLVAAVGLGTLESVVSRLRMRAVPAFVAVALTAGAVAVTATLWGAR